MGTINHYRNGYNDGNYSMNEVQSWSYVTHDPGSGNCYTTTDNGDGTYNEQQSPHGCYELQGPGFDGYDYNY